MTPHPNYVKRYYKFFPFLLSSFHFGRTSRAEMRQWEKTAIQITINII